VKEFGVVRIFLAKHKNKKIPKTCKKATKTN